MLHITKLKLGVYTLRTGIEVSVRKNMNGDYWVNIPNYLPLQWIRYWDHRCIEEFENYTRRDAVRNGCVSLNFEPVPAAAIQRLFEKEGLIKYEDRKLN